MLIYSFEVANERMDDYRREAEKYRMGAEVRRLHREEERRKNSKMTVDIIHEIVNRLSFRSHEVARG
jgi:hypothetical protein